MAVEQRGEIFSRQPRHVETGFDGGARNVGRKNHVGSFFQTGVEVRLVLEDVQRRSCQEVLPPIAFSTDREGALTRPRLTKNFYMCYKIQFCKSAA